MQAGLKNAGDSIKAFSETDFTEDLKKFDVPTLVMLGEDDQIVPVKEASVMTSNLKPPHVIIVGGGFGGLYAARGLAHAHVQVTILDKHNYHLFRPMLYQVATGLLSADEIAAPIRSIFRRQKNVEVFMDEVVGVDPQRRFVQTADRSVHYDYLVLATGIHYNYFGHDEWKKFAPGLDSVDDADRIRGRILTAFEAAEHKAAESGANHTEIAKLLTFVLVGGGTAGVELAGTIAEIARMALTGDFRHINPREAHIILFEAAPRILPSYPEELSDRACVHLREIGVDVRTNAKVESVDASGVIVNGQRVWSSTVLWSAGVVASPAGQWLGAETDRAGRVKVTADLSVPGLPNVFVIGDTAAWLRRREIFSAFGRDRSCCPASLSRPYKRANMLPASSNGGSQDNHRRSRSHIGTKGTFRSSAAALPCPTANGSASPAWWHGSYGSAFTFTFLSVLLTACS